MDNTNYETTNYGKKRGSRRVSAEWSASRSGKAAMFGGIQMWGKRLKRPRRSESEAKKVKLGRGKDPMVRKHVAQTVRKHLTNGEAYILQSGEQTSYKAVMLP